MTYLKGRRDQSSERPTRRLTAAGWGMRSCGLHPNGQTLARNRHKVVDKREGAGGTGAAESVPHGRGRGRGRAWTARRNSSLLDCSQVPPRRSSPSTGVPLLPRSTDPRAEPPRQTAIGPPRRCASSAARPAPAATAPKQSCGAARSTSSPWQHATDKSVLGDFNDASFDYYGVHSRFFRKDGKFLVETDGSDGKLAVFEVKYTFGLDPLQQYLVEFPDGRVQALSLAWDSRPTGQGRPALVPPLSERGDQTRRRPALDQAQSELELHVRRVPFDRRAQELRCDERSLRHDLCRDQRRLRGLSRTGLASRRLGAATRQSWWPFGKD